MEDIEDIGISVIIPFYNGIEFLEESINSAVKQTYKKLEIIIGVNGHDNSSPVLKIINEIIFKNKNKRNIRLIIYDVKSAPLTLNKMAIDAIYPYIAFLDADDMWVLTKLEEQMPYILNGYDVVGTHAQYIGNLNYSPNIPLNDITEHDIFTINPLLHSSILIKKELVLFEDHFIYDYNLWFKLYYLNKKIYNVPKKLLYHRIHNNSAFNGTNENYLKELKEKWKNIYRKNI